MGKKNESNSVLDLNPDYVPLESTAGYPDILPQDQGGNYTIKYDETFLDVSVDVDIPFALLKAVAKRESAFDQYAIRNEPATTRRPPSASYGLMQILWWKDSDRFKKYGYPDDNILGGSQLYLPYVNIYIGARIMKDNLIASGNLRDAINMYNTGVKESVRVAPNNYVNDILKCYSTIVKRTVT